MTPEDAIAVFVRKNTVGFCRQHLGLMSNLAEKQDISEMFYSTIT